VDNDGSLKCKAAAEVGKRHKKKAATETEIIKVTTNIMEHKIY